MTREEEIRERLKDVEPTFFGDWGRKESRRHYKVQYMKLEELDNERITILDVTEVEETRYRRKAVEMLLEVNGQLVGLLTSAKIFVDNAKQIKENVPVIGRIKITEGRVEVI